MVKQLLTFTENQRLPWKLRQYRISLQCVRPGFDPWVGKIPWRRAWLPVPVFLPGESHGQRSLAGYSPRGRKESDTTKRLIPWLSDTEMVADYMRVPKSSSGFYFKPDPRGSGVRPPSSSTSRRWCQLPAPPRPPALSAEALPWCSEYHRHGPERISRKFYVSDPGLTCFFLIQVWNLSLQFIQVLHGRPGGKQCTIVFTLVFSLYLETVSQINLSWNTLSLFFQCVPLRYTRWFEMHYGWTVSF